MPSGNDPRRRYGPARARHRRADWLPDPITHHATAGPPRTDTGVWWRLWPGVKENGRFVRRSVLHGGTCRDWPPGRHPPGALFLNRVQAREALAHPDEVVECPLCRPRWSINPTDWRQGPRTT